MVINQPLSAWNYGPRYEMKPIPNTSHMAKNLTLDKSWAKGKKTKTVFLLKKHNNKMATKDSLVYSQISFLFNCHQ